MGEISLILFGNHDENKMYSAQQRDCDWSIGKETFQMLLVLSSEPSSTEPTEKF